MNDRPVSAKARASGYQVDHGMLRVGDKKKFQSSYTRRTVDSICSYALARRLLNKSGSQRIAPAWYRAG